MRVRPSRSKFDFIRIVMSAHHRPHSRPSRMFLAACLLAPVFAVCADEASWRCGAAKVEITPSESLWMAGYAARGEPAEGKATPLWAKALVLEDAEGERGVVVTLDLVGIGRELSREVCGRLMEAHDLERRQIVLATSHTHSGPVVGKNLGPLHFWNLGEEHRRLISQYADRLVDRIDGVVDEAMDGLEPSRVQWGSGLATFAVNRRENKPYDTIPERRATGELEGPVDHDVPVLSIRDEEGTLRAVLFGYACHATTVSFNQWSGDYPGYAQRELEKRYPHCVALFWAGCGGDQNPLPRRTVKLAEGYGAELAGAVADVLAAPMPRIEPNLDLHYREIELALQQLPNPEDLSKAERFANRFEAARARVLQQELEEKGAIKGVYPYPVGVWRLGDEVDFVHLGGEVVIDYAKRLERELRGERTWVAGYAHDVMAYIPSLRVLKEGGYEGGGSNVYYGLPGLWDEGIEEHIVETVHELARP